MADENQINENKEEIQSEQINNEQKNEISKHSQEKSDIKSLIVISQAENNNNIEPKNSNIMELNKNVPVDASTLVLKKEDEIHDNNNTLNQLNIEKGKNKNVGKENENKNIKQNFIQRTKSWMSNMWTNVKNYDYGKFNIFKKTEMEDCLDAHGNPMRIPKRKNKKPIIKKKEDDKDFHKYKNLNYNRYYSSYTNVFAGYPF